MNNQADIIIFRARRRKCEKILLAVILFLFLFTQYSCDTAEPLPEGGVGLTLEEVSCTEIWLTLTVVNLSPTAYIQLYQNGTLINTIDVISIHTPLLIDSLSPGTEYIFEAFSSQRGNEIRSNKLIVTTLDTTSHNFTWQTFTFGDHSNSILRDVVVIDENNIYAAGTIYLNDSLGQVDPHPYTIAYWNEQNWLFKKIYDTNNQLIPSIRGIKAFSLTDIWLADGGIHKWDGISDQANISFDRISLIGGEENGQSVNGFYGTSPDNLFGFGWKGMITKYNIDSWQKMQSNTEVDLLDIWGNPEGTVWACGYTGDYATTVLLRYDGTIWNKVYEGNSSNQNNNEYIGPTSGIWTNSKFFTYVASWGKIYRQPNDNILNIKRLTPNFSDVAFAMRGTDHNNIFIAGQDGLVGHYNGVTYTEFNELKENAKNYLGVAVKDNIAVAVGVK
ncbi:MAG: hypothetical protein KGZ85_04240, partial [Ignavibacterium sp.]|nr:hypothetical protein [Ignavibacterium sp.]